MSQPKVRLIRAVPDPLGLYIRAGRNDQATLLNFIASGDASLSGVVFEAKRVSSQRELLAQVLDHKLDAVLDPQTQAMATVAGYSNAMDSLPWCAKRSHTRDDFAKELQRRRTAELIAQFVVDHGFTQVLAPTHLVASAEDPWLEVDVATTNALRTVLERSHAGHVQIIYSLAVSYEAFRVAEKRAGILERLKPASIDSVWLNIEGCGSDSKATRVTRYADAASDFHVLGKPIVADHVGGLVGLSLRFPRFFVFQGQGIKPPFFAHAES